MSNMLAGPCDAGHSLDPASGCQPCPENEWSLAGNTEAECTKCPAGKVVGQGAGTKESDCTPSKFMFNYQLR